jgi:ornithine decarboxylase
MKTMKIAVSRELISTLSTHRQMVTLDSTDFTDVAAVVITLAESRSGILALLKRTGFNVPVFLFDQTLEETPDGVTAVINGKAGLAGAGPPPVIMKIICCRRFSIRCVSMSR